MCRKNSGRRWTTSSWWQWPTRQTFGALELVLSCRIFLELSNNCQLDSPSKSPRTLVTYFRNSDRASGRHPGDPLAPWLQGECGTSVEILPRLFLHPDRATSNGTILSLTYYLVPNFLFSSIPQFLENQFGLRDLAQHRQFVQHLLLLARLAFDQFSTQVGINNESI